MPRHFCCPLHFLLAVLFSTLTFGCSLQRLVSRNDSLPLATPTESSTALSPLPSHRPHQARDVFSDPSQQASRPTEKREQAQLSICTPSKNKPRILSAMPLQIRTPHPPTSRIPNRRRVGSFVARRQSLLALPPNPAPLVVFLAPPPIAPTPYRFASASASTREPQRQSSYPPPTNGSRELWTAFPYSSVAVAGRVRMESRFACGASAGKCLSDPANPAPCLWA